MPLSREIQELLDNAIDSLAKWDLINYMQQNPNNLISPTEIAGCLGRTPNEVSNALTELSNSRLVEYKHDGTAIYYRYHPDKRWREHVSQFIQGLTNKSTRWLILNYLVEKHGFERI